MSDRLEDIKEWYEHIDGIGCNAELFEGLYQEGANKAAHDMGWLISEVEQLRYKMETMITGQDAVMTSWRQIKDEMERLRTENELLKKIRSGQASLIQHIDTEREQ